MFGVREATAGEREGLEDRCVRGDDGVGVGDLAASDSETSLADIDLFMRLAGSSDEGIAGARGSSFWPGLEALAPTLAYDAACLGDGRPPVARLVGITQPVLVATGGRPDPHLEGLGPGFFDEAANAIAAALPDAERRIIDGETHVADPQSFAAVLEQFFTSTGGLRRA
ncbi:hypothetical protein [Kribbella sp. NPDC003557]|uniref:hypothetical protein n=1 Tax=Kribbella sp. NPDC003557 TaxID=3154449 RepID=UPI0033A9F120